MSNNTEDTLQDNPYAPPKAHVEGAFVEPITAPPLWNPNAAANWSLLLTPIFGSFLHWKNWIALGDAGQANKARFWFIASVIEVAGTVLYATGSHSRTNLRLLNIAFLVAWYFAAAKWQARLVKERYDTHYPRRGFALPILIALGTLVVSVLMLGVIVAMGRI